MDELTVEITFPEGTSKEKEKTFIQQVQALIDNFNKHIAPSILALLSVSIILL